MQTSELQIKIGKKVKELRLVNDWTQEEAAKQLNMCRNTYSDIELGKSDISISRLVQLTNFFGVEISYFVDDKEKVVIYLAGTQNIQSAKNQKIKDCHIYPREEKLQHELEKQQLIIELKDKELAMQHSEIENLKVQIAQLQKINALLEKNA